MGITKGKKAAPAKGRLIDQKGIEAEYGIPTRDVLAAVQRDQFPAPVRVIGKKRWFRRADVRKFLGKDQEAEAGGA